MKLSNKVTRNCACRGICLMTPNNESSDWFNKLNVNKYSFHIHFKLSKVASFCLVCPKSWEDRKNVMQCQYIGIPTIPIRKKGVPVCKANIIKNYFIICRSLIYQKMTTENFSAVIPTLSFILIRSLMVTWVNHAYCLTAM